MSQLIKCLYCPQSTIFFRFAKQLEAHIAAEHLNLFQYKCQLCKFMWLPTEYALAKHYSDVHEIVSGIPFDACKEPDYPGKTKKLNELKDKLKNCIEVSQVLDNRNKSQLELTPCDRVKCQDCSLQFNNREWLEAHIASVHLHSMPYRCELCENACFPTEYTLKRHYCHDHETSNFEITSNFSLKVVKEREELVKKMELCMIRRKIGRRMEDLEANSPGSQPEDVTVKVEPSGSYDSCESRAESSEIPTTPQCPTTTPVSQQQNSHVTTGAQNVPVPQPEDVVVKMEPLFAPTVPPGFAPMPWGFQYSGPMNTPGYQDDSMQYQQNGYLNVTYQTEDPPKYQYDPPGLSIVPESQNESFGIPAQLPMNPHYFEAMNTPGYQEDSMQYQQNVYPNVPGYPAENSMMLMEPPIPQYEDRNLPPGVYSVVGPLCPPGFQGHLNLPATPGGIQTTLTLVAPCRTTCTVY